ncbi:hypothetical protein A9X03_19760 [Mycobacterium sp. E1715]|nr:hypothetical protein A9X03_19760 [Mycobacterium sp. E1715]
MRLNRRVGRRLDRHLGQLPWRQSHRAAARERISLRQIFAEILKALREVGAVRRDISERAANPVQFAGRACGALGRLLALGSLLGGFSTRRLRTFRSRLRQTAAQQ